MKFLDSRGHYKKVKLFKYTIDWDKPSRSKFQTRVKKALKEFWFGELVYEEFPVVGTRLKIDFYNATREIAIEVDGSQHYEFNKFFHNDNRMNFLGQLKRDDEKETFCCRNRIKLHRIIEADDIQAELEKINK